VTRAIEIWASVQEDIHRRSGRDRHNPKSKPLQCKNVSPYHENLQHSWNIGEFVDSLHQPLQEYPTAQGSDADLLIANEIVAHKSLQKQLLGLTAVAGSEHIVHLLGTVKRSTEKQVRATCSKNNSP
jgi:hypothetical protein